MNGRGAVLPRRLAAADEADPTHAPLARMARVTKAAMITYAIAKGLGRTHANVSLPTYLEVLRRDLARKTGRIRKRQA
jgi:hypothetical protein